MSRYSIDGAILEDIADAINAKTGEAAAMTPGEMADAISSISGGRSSVPSKDVNFIDYDGTVVYSYTAAEFAELTAMPDNPSHDGLTSQGWNWSLSDAQTYVAKYGKLNVGQMYITDDGKTRIYIHLEEGRLSPYLGLAINGTAVVDWGDESETNTVTGTSDTTVIKTQHTYATVGDYVIVINVTGSMTLPGGSSNGSQLLAKGNAAVNIDKVYQNAVRRVEIGSSTTIGNHAFRNCRSLSSITIPKGMISIGDSMFHSCSSLSSITIPDSVTSIESNAFYSCYSLSSVTIPGNITSIGSKAFNNCSSLLSLIIPDNVMTTGNNMFSGCYSFSSIIISDNMTSIDSYTFNNCYSLSNVTIPNNITSISAYAFSNCYGLGFIRFKSTTPPAVTNSGVFSGVPNDCIIYVPTGSLEAYTTATNYPSSSTYTYVEY